MRTWLPLLGLVAWLPLSGAAADAATVLRWGEVLAADHPQVLMIDRIARKVAETTNLPFE